MDAWEAGRSADFITPGWRGIDWRRLSNRRDLLVGHDRRAGLRRHRGRGKPADELVEFGTPVAVYVEPGRLAAPRKHHVHRTPQPGALDRDERETVAGERVDDSAGSVGKPTRAVDHDRRVCQRDEVEAAHELHHHPDEGDLVEEDAPPRAWPGLAMYTCDELLTGWSNLRKARDDLGFLCRTADRHG